MSRPDCVLTTARSAYAHIVKDDSLGSSPLALEPALTSWQLSDATLRIELLPPDIDRFRQYSSMGIVEDLLAHPGLYVGLDDVVNTDRVGAARIVVTPLPGQAGVALDYEIFNPSTPDRLRGHVEHTVVGHTHQGPTVMVISDMHAASLAILRETEPGVFEAEGEPTPYPMKVVLSMPEPGHLRHAWWFGAPGEEAIERVVADVFRT